MVRQSNRGELLAAWRSLSGVEETEGWRTIPVATGGPCRILAGRRFPDNEEVLLVGFTSVRLPLAEKLPQGGGFVVCKATLGQEGAGRDWIALCRQSAGNIEFFTMMVDDVLSTLGNMGGSNDERIFHVFLSRIRAWQDFMQRGSDDVLSPEAELGLFGELEMLRNILSIGLPASTAVDAWQGPLDGLQDFAFGIGAVEVKSTVSSNGFSATIGSLEQLDNSLIQPLFLAGVRLSLDASGKTLPEMVNLLRDILRSDSVVLGMFNSRLLHAGFLDAVSERYTRRFLHVRTRVLAVIDSFPKLTRANVGIEIRKVRYELDLELVNHAEIELGRALEQLGVI